MEAVLLLLANSLQPLSSLLAPSGSGSDERAQLIGPQEPLVQFFVRRDNGDPTKQINVFAASGKPLLAIQRLNRLSVDWEVYEVYSRTHVATIHAGPVTQYVDFLTKPHLQHRRIHRHGSGLAQRQFYLNDGPPYQWNPHTQYLERVINPQGGSEETRYRVARASRLRPSKFDWEILVAKTFDPDIAIITGIIPMLTVWRKVEVVGAPGTRTYVPRLAGPIVQAPTMDAEPSAQSAKSIPPELVFYQKEKIAEGFFNPPQFLG